MINEPQCVDISTASRDLFCAHCLTSSLYQNLRTKANEMLGRRRNFYGGDHPDFSHNPNANNSASGTQNPSHRRDQNYNSGSGPMTVNNHRYADLIINSTLNIVPAVPRQPPGLDSPGSGAFAMSNDDSTNGRERRAPAGLSTRPRTRIASPRPSSGRQSTPEKLGCEESPFLQSLGNSEQYDDLLTIAGEDAQEASDDLQWLSKYINDTGLQMQIVHTSIKLFNARGLFPECLRIGEMKNLSQHPVKVGVFADIWTGDTNGVKMAVKVMRYQSDTQKHKQVVKALIREAMVWRNLDHPSILPLTGIDFLNGNQEQICLVMPWMENGNLLQFLRAHPELGLETQLTLTKDVAHGLAYLHDRKITHGDLKSYNVLITPDRRACITDLGLSRVFVTLGATGLSTTSGCLRPVRWLAPERLRGGARSIISPEGDIYAFGCICYEIYARSVPFENIEEHKIYYVVGVQNQHLKLPSRLAPHAMRRLMESCCNPEPASRPKAVDIVDKIGRFQTALPGLIIPENSPRLGNVQGLFGTLYNWLLRWFMSLL
ncbi:hypothetical protein PM082_013293 [Marasmius tenuissimus]|nr:hypothetical protein PM082_013293 [Marasmius tenuissimus]